MKKIFLQINKSSYRAARGFTIIEALVSVMVITMLILGPLTVAINASSYAKQTKDTMIAIYLAQEALELLRHQQDSIFIRCTRFDDTFCELQNGETPREAAWRIFKNRLGSNAQGSSCYAIDNSAGCAYDFIDMLSNEDLDPAKYLSTSQECRTLSISEEGLYVCSGIHGVGQGYDLTTFSRQISITAIDTFSGSDAAYNDDLRVIVNITFRKNNGYTKVIKIVDFLHARA